MSAQRDQSASALFEDVAANIALRYTAGRAPDTHIIQMLSLLMDKDASARGTQNIDPGAYAKGMANKCFPDQSDGWRDGFIHYAAQALTKAKLNKVKE